MTGTVAEETDVTRILNRDASAQILSQACRKGALVRLHVTVAGVEAICTGVAVANDRSKLTIKVRRIAPSVAAVLRDSAVRADIGLADAWYTFETRSMSPVPQVADGLLHITAPTAMSVIERRKSRRRRFHGPSEVTLRAIGGTEPWHGRARLLNLSADGIACKVREEDTPRTTTGRRFHVLFRLDGSRHEFNLIGRVVNVTRGGSLDHAVVGMQFVDEDQSASDIRTLREALQHAG